MASNLSPNKTIDETVSQKNRYRRENSRVRETKNQRGNLRDSWGNKKDKTVPKNTLPISLDVDVPDHARDSCVYIAEKEKEQYYTNNESYKEAKDYQNNEQESPNEDYDQTYRGKYNSM